MLCTTVRSPAEVSRTIAERTAGRVGARVPAHGASGAPVTESPFFFESETARLFGMLHAPGAVSASRTAFVMSHPFGEEKLWSHRVFVVFARALRGAGHSGASLRLHGRRRQRR